jgi:nucleoside-diphosphate-sugar epimerase
MIRENINMKKDENQMNHIIYEDLQHLYKNKYVNWNRFRNKTILITGAYGMIASYIVYMLVFLNDLKDKYNIKLVVLCKDKNKLCNRFGKYANNSYFTVIEGDLTDLNVLKDKKIDFIVHAASPAGTEHFIKNPVGVIIPNTIGTYNLLEFAKSNSIEGFLYMSSNSIYGVTTEYRSITELDYGVVDPLNERACYIESKRLGEQMCNAYFRQYGIPTKIVRISHTYGPTLDIATDNRIIARICKNILKGNEIVLFRDEDAKVQYSYIADVIIGCIKVLLDGDDGEAYNVCSDEFLPMHEIAEIIVSLFPNKGSKIVYKEITDEYKFNQNKGINNCKCCNQKLKDLGWSVEYPLLSGFKRTIESFE